MGALGEASPPSCSTVSSAGLTPSPDHITRGKTCLLLVQHSHLQTRRRVSCSVQPSARWRRAPIPKVDATIATCTQEETRSRLVVAAGWSLNSPEVPPRTHLLTCCIPSLVRYCSKECQVAAWRTHKQRCSSTLRESLVNDPEANALNTALSKWINNWRFELHNWAIWAMDLANNSPDRLATHR